MKVLVISHMYPTVFSKLRGIFVHQQVKELQSQGCEVRVVSAVPLAPFPAGYLSSQWRTYSQAPLNGTWDGVEVHYPRYSSYPRAMFFASSGRRMYSGIRRVVAQLSRDFGFDIMHAHVALPDGYAATMLKRQHRRPLVVTIHGMDLQTTIHKSSGCRSALAHVFRQADMIATVSTKLRTMAEANLGFSDKLVVINDGIDPADVTAGSLGSRSECAAGNVMLSVSNLIASKGLDLNIRAFSLLGGKYPHLKYVIIGRGPEERSLRRLAESLNLGDRVEFLGEISHEETMRHMASADLLSLPSWREGFGVVYIEAMALGKPVIACEGEGIADAIEDGKTGMLAKPRDVPSLARAMDFLLGNQEEAQKIGARAKKLVLADFTWEKNVRKYVGIYEELLATHA